MLTADDLRTVGVDVISLRAVSERQTEGHTVWSVNYAPEPEAEESGRVVFATLHCFGDRGGGEVTVASIVLYPGSENPTSEEFEAALRDSEALESIYDISRMVLRSVSSFVNVDLDVDLKAPEASFGLLVRAESVAAEHDGAELSEKIESPS